MAASKIASDFRCRSYLRAFSPFRLRCSVALSAAPLVLRISLLSGSPNVCGNRQMIAAEFPKLRLVQCPAIMTKGEANPRFVVTSLRRNACKAKHLYEKVYCARGEMENRIKECQLDLYADRTSAALTTMLSSSIRVLTFKYCLLAMCTFSTKKFIL